MNHENTIQEMELKGDISWYECIWRKHRPAITEKTAGNLLQASEYIMLETNVYETEHIDLYVHNS
jgi:hypothetical protein